MRGRSIVLFIVFSFPLLIQGEDRIVPVKTMRVERGEIREYLEYPGEIIPYQRVSVYPQVSGILKKLYVREGDQVKKGQLLAEIDHQELFLQMEKLKATLKMINSELEKVKRDYQRFSALRKEESVSERDFERIKFSYQSLQAKQESIKADIALLEKKIRDSFIRSPIQGVVEKRLVEEGELVTSSTLVRASPLFIILRRDRMKVRFFIPEKDLPRLKTGLRAEVVVDAYPREKFWGNLSLLSPSLDPLTRTSEGEIVLENTQNKLRPAMFARVRIILGEKKDTLRIKKDALLEGRKVFVVKEGKAELRRVTLGLEGKEWVEIISGLEEGESVVIRGQRILREGDKVRIVQ